MHTLRIALIHVYYLMYFYYPLLLVIYMLSVDKLVDLLLYLTLSMMCYIAAELLYVYQTVGVWIGKWLPNLATTDHIASHVGLTEIGIPCEI